MIAFFNMLQDFFLTKLNQILAAFSTFDFFDALDILFVAYIIYKAIDLIRETRAKQLFKGIAVLIFVWLLAKIFSLICVDWLINKLLDYGIIALVVIFQPEIRRALERMGKSNLSKFGMYGASSRDRNEQIKSINEICKAAQFMSDDKVGALIVIERETLLGDIITTGTTVNADISHPLLCNIFYPKSPLHDGAVIIRDGRVCAAGCILPLSNNRNINRQLGTRHRAGIGVTEVSDSLVIIVSEETGNISLVINGIITRNYSGLTLNDKLVDILVPKEEKKSIKQIFKKNK